MRAYPPHYELTVPRTLPDALALLARAPGQWRPFAGGTDLMVLFEAGRLAHKKFFSICHLPELRGIEATAEAVTLGALTSYAQVQRDETLRREFPMLCQAAGETGGPAIQNRGTLGGNICNASPAADSPPALLAYDAELELVSAEGTRVVPYKDFHLAYKQTAMRADELLSRIRLRRAAKPWRHYYRKVGTRKAQAISKVCLAGAARVEDDGRVAEVRIALASVAPTVLRCTATEKTLINRRLDASVIADALHELRREITPIDDIRSTAGYRRRVALNLLADFLREMTP